MKNQSGFLSKDFLNTVPVICACMVIGIHVYNVTEGRSAIAPTPLIEGFFSHGLCTAAVPTFLFLSGFLFFRNISGYSEIFNKQKKRIGSVFVPFLAWSAFYYLFHVITAKLPLGVSTSVDYSVLGIIKSIVFYQHAFLLWYMFQLSIYIALSHFICFLIKNKLAGFLVLAGCSVLGMCDISINIPLDGEPFALFQFNYFAYYFLGCLMTQFPQQLDGFKAWLKKIPLGVFAALFIISGLIESLFFDKRFVSFNNRCFVPLVFITFFLFMLKLFSKDRETRPIKVSTMVIYGIHPFVQTITWQVLKYLPLPLLAMYFISFIVVVIMSYAAGYVMKYIKPVYRIFSGNR